MGIRNSRTIYYLRKETRDELEVVVSQAHCMIPRKYWDIEVLWPRGQGVFQRRKLVDCLDRFLKD
jgi:hypothetical protein